MPFDPPFGSQDGITPHAQFAIIQTESLAERIQEHELHNVPVPQGLEACMHSLSAHLQYFRPDDDVPLALDPTMDKHYLIYNNLEVAWYLAASIYFHNRINNSFGDDLTMLAVDDLAACLVRAEALKAQVQPDVRYRDAPVTFPAFVASLNAIDREPWVFWWERVQEYSIPKVYGQWQVVQIVWEIMDDTREMGDFSWVDVMQQGGARRLSWVFEDLGFY